MSDINKILSEEGDSFSEEELMAYLKKQLSATDEASMHEAIAQDEFMKEAMQGLQEVKDKEKINQSVAQLNKQLSKTLAAKAGKKRKRKIPSNQYTLIAIVVILILSTLGYLVLHLITHK